MFLQKDLYKIYTSLVKPGQFNLSGSGGKKKLDKENNENNKNEILEINVLGEKL
jgi:hypothetical protein